MNNLSETEILQLIHHLRKKSGIQPIPFSQEEIDRGVASSFASAMTPEKKVALSQPPPRPRLQETVQPPPPPAKPTPIQTEQEAEVANSIGKKPLNHQRSFSLKC